MFSVCGDLYWGDEVITVTCLIYFRKGERREGGLLVLDIRDKVRYILGYLWLPLDRIFWICMGSGFGRKGRHYDWGLLVLGQYHGENSMIVKRYMLPLGSGEFRG